MLVETSPHRYNEQTMAWPGLMKHMTAALKGYSHCEACGRGVRAARKRVLWRMSLLFLEMFGGAVVQGRVKQLPQTCDQRSKRM